MCWNRLSENAQTQVNSSLNRKTDWLPTVAHTGRWQHTVRTIRDLFVQHTWPTMNNDTRWVARSTNLALAEIFDSSRLLVLHIPYLWFSLWKLNWLGQGERLLISQLFNHICCTIWFYTWVIECHPRSRICVPIHYFVPHKERSMFASFQRTPFVMSWMNILVKAFNQLWYFLRTKQNKHGFQKLLLRQENTMVWFFFSQLN